MLDTYTQTVYSSSDRMFPFTQVYMLFFKYKFQETVFKIYIGKMAFVYINALLQTLVEVVVDASPYQYLIHFNYE